MKLHCSTLAAALFASALIGLSPGWVQAAEITKKPDETKQTQSRTNRLDINTASPEELKGIQGITEAQAKKIIEGRPYTKRAELLSKKILTRETYDKIKSQIGVRRSAGKSS